VCKGRRPARPAAGGAGRCLAVKSSVVGQDGTGTGGCGCVCLRRRGGGGTQGTDGTESAVLNVDDGTEECGVNYAPTVASSARELSSGVSSSHIYNLGGQQVAISRGASWFRPLM